MSAVTDISAPAACVLPMWQAGAWVNILESEQVTGLGTDAAGVVSPLPLRPSYAHVVFSLGGGAAGSGCVDAYTKLVSRGDCGWGHVALSVFLLMLLAVCSLLGTVGWGARFASVAAAAVARFFLLLLSPCLRHMLHAACCATYHTSSLG